MLIRLHPEALWLGAAADDARSHRETFVRDDGPGGVELYEDGTAERAAGDLDANVLFAGGSYGPQAGEWLFMVGLWTPRDYREEFLGWYKIEHIPILLECAAWDGCRFVETPDERGCQFYALHQLASRAALDSNERQVSRATPWFRRLAQHAWFDGAFARTLYRRPENAAH